MTGARCKLRRAAAVLLTGVGLAAVGCVTDHPIHEAIAEHRGGVIAVPPPGEVPAELSKVQLPEYVIEPPDVLWIQVATLARVGAETGKDKKDELAGDQLRSLPIQPIQGDHTVRPDGTVYLGVYGSVPVAGYTISQAAQAIREAV